MPTEGFRQEILTLMRVLHYWPRGAVGDGGISRSLRALSRSMSALGDNVTIAYDEPGPALATDGIEWHAVRHVGPRRMRIPVGLTGPFSVADVVVLHSAWTAHNQRAAAVARATGTPYVLAPRGAYDPSILGRRPALKRAWWRALEQGVIAGARALHIFFECQRSHLRALGYHGDLIVAPNGVDARPGMEWEGSSSDYLLYLGRFDPEHKGLDLLLHAVAAMPRRTRPRILMHGSDWRGGKARVTTMVDEHDLGGWIVVGDPVLGSAKWTLLSRARGLVYPSRWEAFGNSVAEAAAIGVPVLTTPYPLGRYLGERGGSIVVDPEPEKIAHGLLRLMDPIAADVGKRAREVVRRDFSWAAVAERWRSQLATLVGR